MEAAYEKGEAKRVAHKRHMADYMRRKREKDPDYFVRQSAMGAARLRERYHQDARVREASAARCRSCRAETSILLSLRVLFA